MVYSGFNSIFFMTTMIDQPITPPPELRAKWVAEARFQDYCSVTEQVADHAAKWGYDQRGEVNDAELQKARDQELEATLAEVTFLSSQAFADRVRALRRPKPPTQAEKALNHFESFSATFETSGGDSDLIRRALVRLKQLEDSNG